MLFSLYTQWSSHIQKFNAEASVRKVALETVYNSSEQQLKKTASEEIPIYRKQ